MSSPADRVSFAVLSALRWLCGLGAAVFILLFLGIALLRFTYPFELEWMEGAMVDHVARVLDGQSIYVEPTVDFAPFRYAPLYFYVSALPSLFTGPALWPMRLVSILSFLASLALLFQFVRRETGRQLPGLFAAGLLAASFPITGAFYDLARLDSLFLALLLAAAYVFRFHLTARGAFLAGLLFALAFLTKQAAGPVAAFVILAGLLVNRRQAILAGLIAAAATVAVSLLFNLTSHGWYYFYVFQLGDNIFPTRGFLDSIRAVFLDDLLRAFPIAAPLALAALIDIVARGDRPARWFYRSFAAGMIAITFLARIHPGGWTNTLIPASAVIALLFGLAIGRFESIADTFTPAVRRSASFALYTLLLIQLALWSYDPRPLIPTAADTAAGRRLVARLAEIPGDVYIPYHGHLATLAGKRSFAHFQAIRDIWSSPDHAQIRRRLTSSIADAIRNRRFGAILLDRDFFQPQIDSAYTPAPPVFDRPDIFFPRSGWLVRPDRLYLEKTN